MIRALRKRSGRAFWIAVALLVANEIRGIIVVIAILSAWGWMR
jgi:hypothetical protein